MSKCDHNWKHLGFAPEFCQRRWWGRRGGALKTEDIADKGRCDYQYPTKEKQNESTSKNHDGS